jgi:hypothetical protein
MLRVAREHQWKRCPAAGCGHMVERTEGCNHMRCRCGCDFCYACGSRYSSSVPTPDNVHGTPGCRCPLFAVPEEEDPAQPGAKQGPAAPAQGGAVQPVQGVQLAPGHPQQQAAHPGRAPAPAPPPPLPPLPAPVQAARAAPAYHPQWDAHPAPAPPAPVMQPAPARPQPWGAAYYPAPAPPPGRGQRQARGHAGGPAVAPVGAVRGHAGGPTVAPVGAVRGHPHAEDAYPAQAPAPARMPQPGCRCAACSPRARPAAAHLQAWNGYPAAAPARAAQHGQGCGCAGCRLPMQADAGHPQAWAAYPAPAWPPAQAARAPAPQPVLLRQYRPRPWRAGRSVSSTPCRYSLSIYDCPRGPHQCWFKHIEDDF